MDFDGGAPRPYGVTMSEITTTLEKLAADVNADAALVRRGRYLNLDFLLGIGDETHYFTISHGKVAAVAPGPALLRSRRFAIHIEAAAWAQFRHPVPRPGYHDLFAMCKRGEARIEGELHPLMANLRYFKELLSLARKPETEAVGHGG